MDIVLSFLQYGKDKKLVSSHDSFSDAQRRWDAEDTKAMQAVREGQERRWFAVRDVRDELAIEAFDAYRLTDRQKCMLVALSRAQRDPKGRGGSQTGFIYEAGLNLFGKCIFFVPVQYKQLHKKGLMGAFGVKYGAKRYFLTDAGRAAVQIIRANEAFINHDNFKETA